MDFVVALPYTTKWYDSIWVIVDHLTKSTHFLSVDTRYSAKKYAKLYFNRIVILHGVPLTIVSHFWEQLQKCHGTSLLRSLAYHPQTDGQTERVNQVLEDMLRACVISYPKKWDECLTLAEFLITIAIKKAFVWHLLRPCMARNVEHLLTGLKWVIVVTSDLILSRKLKSKLVLFRVI